MLLGQVRVVELGPLGDVVVRFVADERPRLATAIVGAGGTGKSALLAAIAATRPGHAMPLSRPWSRVAPARAPFAVAEWSLEDKDPARPHPLRVASPNATMDGASALGAARSTLGEREDEAALRRREQTLFDRRATEGGFVCVAISGARWFSRTPVMLSSPERTILRYDPRAAASFDDPTRADLARETKQVLAYAAIAAALAGDAADPEATRARALDASLRAAIAPVARLASLAYVGADPASLEPIFERDAGARVAFDELPSAARHLIAFVALPFRALAGAYPGGDPRLAQGVALIDDVELHQEAHVARGIVPALRDALPRVQWIVATAASGVALGCDAGEIVALRRTSDAAKVEVYEGDLALTH